MGEDKIRTRKEKTARELWRVRGSRIFFARVRFVIFPLLLSESLGQAIIRMTRVLAGQNSIIL